MTLKEWQPTATTDRGGCGISSTQGPPLRTAEVPFLPTGNATWSESRNDSSMSESVEISKRRLRLNHLGRSKVGSEFSSGRSLGSLGFFFFLFQNFLSFQTFFADSQVDLTMGSHYRICVDMDGSRHPQKSIHPFVMKIFMKNHTFESQNSIFPANISNFWNVKYLLPFHF